MLEKYLKLKSDIEKYSYYYYEKSESIISDLEFDKLLKELEQMEIENPNIKSMYSPTSKVGGYLNEKFTKVKHSKPMLSLSNTYNIGEIKDFDKSTKKTINSNINYVLELKLDGLSIDLKYEKGKLVLALTRGDGVFGEDVTENIYQIENIPKILSEEIDIEVRGEIILPLTEFERINTEREENGEDVFSNPRNAASGTIRQIDTQVVANRKLKCFIYFIVNTENFNFKTHLESIEYIKKLGFETTNVFELHNNFNNLEESINKWSTKRKELNFETDGLVLKINELDSYDLLGYTAKSPKWAIAYKFKPDQMETIIKSIDFQVGRTGVITPVANFEPINLSGSIVKRASLHNFDEIKRKDIKLYDTVIVEKAAEIIPQVVSVVFEKRNGNEKLINMPTNCPSCNEKIYSFDDIVAIKCLNKFCSERLSRYIEYFVSRDCMNIRGLGYKITKKLIDLGFITNIIDLYNLKSFKDEIIKLDKMGEKNTQNLLDNIEKSKKNSFDRVLFSLGIPYIGKTTAKLICRNIKNIEELMLSSEEKLTSIKGLGEKAASSIVEFFADDNNKLIIKALIELGFKLENTNTTININPNITGKTFLATGTLNTYKRDEIKEIIENNGGKYLSAVSKNLDFLIVGEKAGSKLKKAQNLNIKIISEQDFKEMLEN